MPVVKHTLTAPLARGAHVLELADMKAEGEQMLADADAESERVLDAAMRAAETMAADADERGFAEGHARGLTEGRAAGQDEGREHALKETGEELQALTTRWNAALDAWEQDRATMLADTRDDLVRLAIALAERLVGRALEVDPSLVVDQVAATLQLVARGSDAVVLVHPADEELVRDAMPTLVERVAGLHHVELEADDTLDRGGCRVRTTRGEIDASIPTQLDRIAESLLPSRPDPAS